MNLGSVFTSKYFLPILIIIAFLLRVHQLGDRGLAGDEKYSLFVSQFTAYEGNNQRNSVRNINSPYFTPTNFWSTKGFEGFNDAIARVDTGNGAFFTFTLHYWTKFFGLSDFSLRFLALIFNLATIILLYHFVKKHFKDHNLAGIATILASFSPFYVAFSQVARNYAPQFFFALLSTHLLLLILQYFEKSQKSFLLYFAYGFSVLLCELCHISTFPLFFAHGIYVLVYYRNLKLIAGLMAAMLIPATGMALWLVSDGGKWMFDYVANSVKTYNIMAENNPDDFLSKATYSNIFKQLIHVLSSLNIFFEGLYLTIIGFKNTIIVLCLALLSTSFYHLQKKTSLSTAIVGISLLLIGIFTSINKISMAVFYVGLVLVFNYLPALWKKQKLKKEFTLITLIIASSILSLIVFAKMDGNTFRIIPRYVGYSYAFCLILFGYILNSFLKDSKQLNYLKALFLTLLSFNLISVLQLIYNDNPPRYFMNFSAPRQQNPHKKVADLIQKSYAIGDTVLHCSFNESSTPGGKDLFSYSVVDAQLINFYLPKNSTIIQRIEKSEPNKVFLKHKNGSKTELFDFEGVKYRY